MTSTAMVQAEIERFLKSTEPEVLCITGDWGVGKTYNWQAQLDKLRSKRDVGLHRYSYVSLFGLNSIDGIKTSIFENLEFIVPEGQAPFERMLSLANQGFQQSKKLASAISAVPKVGDALSKVSQPFLFSSIRSQIVCIDDLERGGKDLRVKDVFGLISFLREQRNCKIVFLLNETKFDSEGKDAKDFKEYFEKVIDTKVVFAPTPAEAAEIAFPLKDADSEMLRKHCVALGMRNIRVLKKIERLVGIVAPIISDRSVEVKNQAVHSLVVLGWSLFDSGANPPPFNFLRQSSVARIMERKDAEIEDPNEERWEIILEAYGFSHADDFDLVLMEFVESSILDEAALSAAAIKQDQKIEMSKRVGSFRDAFKLFHGSFQTNEDEVCGSLIAGVRTSLDVMSLSDLDDVVELLIGLGRESDASGLIDFAVANADSQFWLSDDASFGRPIRNDRIKEIISKSIEDGQPTVNFERDFVEIATSYNHERIAILADQPVEAFVALLESESDVNLKRIVAAALESRRIVNASDEQRRLVAKTEDALRVIGRKSKLNSIRVKKYGINVEAAS